MNGKYKLRSRGCVEIEDEIWFPNIYFNALMKVSKSSGRIQMIDKFPNYDIGCTWLYSTVCHVNGQLVFVPQNSEEIVSYNIEKHKFISVALDKKYIEKADNFLSAYAFENYVYMFPARAKCIIRFDTTDNTITYLENNVSRIINNLVASFCFSVQFEVVDEKIYIPFAELNAVAVFDLRSECVDIRYLDIDGGCTTINYVEGSFYLASSKYARIYCWNIEKDEMKIYDSFPADIVIGDYAFLCGCHIKDKIIFFPDLGRTILSFDMKSGKICAEQEVCNIDGESIITYFVQRGRDGYYALTADMNYICSMDYKDEKLCLEPSFQVDDLFNREQMNQFFMKYVNCFSETEITLEEYINMVASFDTVELTEGED